MRHQQPQQTKSLSLLSATVMRWCLLATAALCVMNPSAVVSAQDNQDADTFFSQAETEALSAKCTNLEFVTYPLYKSDADGNGVLNQEEFVTFANDLSGGWLEELGMANSFLAMPLVLQEANVVLACLCELYTDEPWGQPGCCDNPTSTTGIRTDGAAPGETPDEVELEYLTYVCGTMQESLGRLGAQLVAPPSSSPSGHPSVSPSAKPSVQPVTASPTISPSLHPTTGSPTGSPVSSPITISPTTLFPSDSIPIVPSPSSEPSTTSVPSVSSAFAGDFPFDINFVHSLDGQVKADAVMEGKDNSVKKYMEGLLMDLANTVIKEMNNETTSTVKEATNATVVNVEDIQCPPGMPGNVSVEDECLAWDAEIIVKMENETDPEGTAEEIRRKMLAELASGWLVENFDEEEALKPPSGGPTPNPGEGNQEKELNNNPLSVGGIIGIALAALVLVLLVALFALNRAGRRDDDATEERNAVKDSDNTVAHDLDAAPTDDVSEVTETYSYASGAYLLQGQSRSSAATPLGEIPAESEDENFNESSTDREDEETGFGDTKGNVDAQGASYLAAIGAASTLVASTSARIPRSQQEEAAAFASESGNESGAVSSANVGASPTAAGSRGSIGTGAGGSSGAGLSAGAVAAMGGAVALTAGAIAAGVASRKDEGYNEALKDEVGSPDKESVVSSNSQLDELEIAIEAGDWGHVGALAAVLAAEGRRTPPQGVKSPRSITSGDASSRSRGASTGQSIDQARAAEIDKLVEAGDWQGVVLAAARFEADQTMDGESHSAASASRSSKWSGSGRSSASGTQRSFGGTTHSSQGAGRSQAEIRAEIEALVRRVVPEEADNIDEMLNQFKGREEELVETLRRMQERAIASRARLAVQKSAKLEARARASTPSASGKSVASHGSSKELEQAIEEGNWLAVGQAAQKISDQNDGDLSSEEKARLRQKISQSPAMNLQALSNENVNLDELIERGDWSGVIAAAKAASDGGQASNAIGNISKEERDALAQASMWQAIANQSKQGGGQDAAGAGDAAAWAISRSLNALNSPGEKRSRTINDIADEESSDASQYDSGSYGPSTKSPDYKGSMV